MLLILGPYLKDDRITHLAPPPPVSRPPGVVAGSAAPYDAPPGAARGLRCSSLVARTIPSPGQPCLLSGQLEDTPHI